MNYTDDALSYRTARQSGRSWVASVKGNHEFFADAASLSVAAERFCAWRRIAAGTVVEVRPVLPETAGTLWVGEVVLSVRARPELTIGGAS